MIVITDKRGYFSFGMNDLRLKPESIVSNKCSQTYRQSPAKMVHFPIVCQFDFVQCEGYGSMEFKLHSEYQPTGDQPRAIRELVEGFKKGNQFETLLGVTGSGKTFTMANVIAALNKPTLIISHNKTLAGQLYGEMKEFFPENAVEYFVSYYNFT